MIGNNEREDTRKYCMVVLKYYPLDPRVEREAQALVKHGMEVHVVCLRNSDQPAFSDEEGVRVHRLPLRRFVHRTIFFQLLEYLTFFVLALFGLTSLHLRERFDVVHVHNLPDFLVFIALIPKLTGAKIVLDLHDLMPEFYAERYQTSLDSLKVRAVRLQEMLSCRFADLIITVTEHWRQALIERGQPCDKVKVVMNAADERYFHPYSAEAIEKNGNHFMIIYHGTMGYRQGLDLAVKAINVVREAAPDIQLLLHGRGEQVQALKELVDELCLHKQIQFSAGGVPMAELPKILLGADLAIVPYRNGVFTGGILPTKMMEYSALGIPIIAARTSTIDAYFDDTMVEFFTPNDVEELASCILQLHNDRKRLAHLSREITRFNRQYNWAQQRACFLQYVDELISNHA